jgi:gas vesicle protein
MTQATSEIQTLTKGVIKTTQENNAEMRRTVTDSFTETARLFNTHVQQISKDAADRVVKLDDALGKELNKSLETLGQQLTALSRKFVEDYTPLTDRLRELVQQARRI